MRSRNLVLSRTHQSSPSKRQSRLLCRNNSSRRPDQTLVLSNQHIRVARSLDIRQPPALQVPELQVTSRRNTYRRLPANRVARSSANVIPVQATAGLG